MIYECNTYYVYSDVHVYTSASFAVNMENCTQTKKARKTNNSIRQIVCLYGIAGIARGLSICLLHCDVIKLLANLHYFFSFSY